MEQTSPPLEWGRERRRHGCVVIWSIWRLSFNGLFYIAAKILYMCLVALAAGKSPAKAINCVCWYSHTRTCMYVCVETWNSQMTWLLFASIFSSIQFTHTHTHIHTYKHISAKKQLRLQYELHCTTWPVCCVKGQSDSPLSPSSHSCQYDATRKLIATKMHCNCCLKIEMTKRVAP